MDSVGLSDRQIPTGTAYGMKPGQHNAKLTEVMPGTPCGEFLRRYWHPIALSSEVGRRPQRVRILGEDLILFRDGQDRAGLLYPRCTHRGANLYYGKTEETGIRCCYHGWLFDAEGRCLEQPCEENNGEHRHRVRQPWYPVQERYGLVFAYMGPPDRMPLLPRYDIFEDVPEGQGVFPQRSGYADVSVNLKMPIPFNWMQVFENGADPFHVMILHSTFSGFAQFGDAYKVRPDVEFEPRPAGILNHAVHPHHGKTVDQVEELILPNMKALYPMSMEPGRGRRITWHTPVDDTNHVKFTVIVGRKRGGELDALVMTPTGKTWGQMSEEEHQDYPGDFEAQASQGPITLHSEEHLAQSDKLLDEAGLKPDSSGIRLRMTILYDAASYERQQVAIALKSMWRKIGVDVTVTPLETAVLYPRVYDQWNFDFFLVDYTSLGDPALGVARSYVTASIKGRFGNAAGYSNPDVDALFAKGGTLSTQEERGAVYKQIQPILVRDVPAIILHQDRNIDAASKRLRDAWTYAGQGFWSSAWLDE